MCLIKGNTLCHFCQFSEDLGSTYVLVDVVSTIFFFFLFYLFFVWFFFWHREWVISGWTIESFQVNSSLKVKDRRGTFPFIFWLCVQVSVVKRPPTIYLIKDKTDLDSWLFFPKSDLSETLVSVYKSDVFERTVSEGVKLSHDFPTLF